MQRQPVRSKSIISIGYDAELQVLEVELNDRAVYSFVQVSYDVYTAFINAFDKDAYFKLHIMDNYWVQKV